MQAAPQFPSYQKRSYLLFLLSFLAFYPIESRSQSYYFPPLNGSSWDTTSPARLGWCPSRIDSLYNYLQATNTKAFIVLYKGKIVLEKYFDGHTVDSFWYWASAGKSLTGFMAGMAQEQGFISLSQTVTHYLGSGWSIAPSNKENLVTIRHLLTMTSGFNDDPPDPCTSLTTSKFCLQYLADAGTRWGYHTGAYLQLHNVFEKQSGQGISIYTKNLVGDRIGMSGLWLNGVFYSTARSMARFGLLSLARGVWGADTLLHDTAYFNQMVNTSQPYNLSYGYLWWLNGKASFMVPGVQFAFPIPFIPSAPADMFAALGLNDQKIYVVPSKDLVAIRMGNSAYDQSAALSKYDDTVWQKLNALTANLPCTYSFTGNGNFSQSQLWKHTIPPPDSLPAGSKVLINGNCVLDKPFAVLPGGELKLLSGGQLSVWNFHQQ